MMWRYILLLAVFGPLLTRAQLSIIELEVKKIPEPVYRDSTVEKWNRIQPAYSKLSRECRDMLYWTNLCRHDPKQFWDSAVVPLVKLFAKLRTLEAKSLESDLLHRGSLPMFSLNETLIGTAQAHASDIAEKKVSPSHISTNGIDFPTRMRLAGIRKYASENISLGSQGILLSVVLLYLDINLPKLPHRLALLDPNLREIGIGSAVYGQDQYFLVQDLASSQ